MSISLRLCDLKLTPRTSYVPGWDCHGLPIENKALAALGVRSLVKRLRFCVLTQMLQGRSTFPSASYDPCQS